MRHIPGGLLLIRAATSVPVVPPRSRRGVIGLLAAVSTLVAATALLLTGVHLEPAAAKGPCPARTSITAYAGGRQLLLRAEPAQGGSALLHLCAEPAIGPVDSWSVAVTGVKGAPLPAQRVSPSMALAAVPSTTALQVGVTVVAHPQTGPPLTFTTELTVGSP